MTKHTENDISLPIDAGPHLFSNVEWWYYFAFLTGDRGGRYALMASFFEVGETEFKKGHYLIYSFIDLNKNIQKNYSAIDLNLKFNMISVYLPIYLFFNPKDTRMWRLYKNLLIGKIPSPHSQIKKVAVKSDPTNLIYGENFVKFYGEKEDSFETNLVGKDLKVELQFTPEKPIALIGKDGKPDHLYYYSITNNKVTGQIHTEKGIENVTGNGWFDHQWGRDYSLLKGGGWNWFGLQLDDGRELLLNEMHSSKGKKVASPMANLIDVDGSVRFTRNVTFNVTKYWKSLQTNAKYPIEWRITIPDYSIQLKVRALFSKQEIPILGPLQAIWEGVCTVTGDEKGSNGKLKKLEGKGFMELVGYAFDK